MVREGRTKERMSNFTDLWQYRGKKSSEINRGLYIVYKICMEASKISDVSYLLGDQFENN